MLESEYAEIAKVELPDGSTIRAEVFPIGGADVSSITEKLRLDEAQDMVREMGRWVVETVNEKMPKPPGEFEVEFGIKLGLESGNLVSILAKANGEASFTVRMSWSRGR